MCVHLRTHSTKAAVCWFFFQELMTVSTRLDSVEHKLEEKRQEFNLLPVDQRSAAKEEIHQLKNKREKLFKERQLIDNKLHEGKILSGAEERRYGLFQMTSNQILSLCYIATLLHRYVFKPLVFTRYFVTDVSVEKQRKCFCRLIYFCISYQNINTNW